MTVMALPSGIVTTLQDAILDGVLLVQNYYPVLGMTWSVTVGIESIRVNGEPFYGIACGHHPELPHRPVLYVGASGITYICEPHTRYMQQIKILLSVAPQP